MTIDPLAADHSPHEIAWDEVELMLDEFGRLSKSNVSRQQFQTRFLDGIVSAQGAVAGAIWRCTPNDTCTLDYDVKLSSSLASEPSSLSIHQSLMDAVSRASEPRTFLPGASDGNIVNQTAWLVLACPILWEGKADYLVEIIHKADTRPSLQREYLRIIVAACELAADFCQRQQLRELRAREAWLQSLVDFSDRLQTNLDLKPTAYTIANESRRLINCDRVTVLQYRHSKATVLSISGVDLFDRRAHSVQALERLANIVIRYDEPLWLPGSSDKLAPEIDTALQAHLDESHARTLAVIPLKTSDTQPPNVVGVLIAERLDAQEEDTWKQRVLAVAQRSTSALASAIEVENLPLRKLSRTLSRAAWFARVEQAPKTIAILLMLIAALVALVVVPADFTLVGRGELQPERRQNIFAAVDGVVAELPVKDQATVRKGDLLVSLESLPFELQFSEVIGKRRTTEEELSAAETELLKNGGNQPDRIGQQGLTTRIEQLKETLHQLTQEHKILQQQREGMQIRSPLDGVVLTWDVARLLSSRPVQRGERLMTVADLSSNWELDLTVPDNQVGHLREAQQRLGPHLPVSFILGSVPGKEMSGSLKRVAESAEIDDDQTPIVRVVASTNEIDSSTFRPGATVVARIHCGRRSLGYVWFHQIWEAIQAKLLF